MTKKALFGFMLLAALATIGCAATDAAPETSASTSVTTPDSTQARTPQEQRLIDDGKYWTLSDSELMSMGFKPNGKTLDVGALERRVNHNLTAVYTGGSIGVNLVLQGYAAADTPTFTAWVTSGNPAGKNWFYGISFNPQFDDRVHREYFCARPLFETGQTPAVRSADVKTMAFQADAGLRTILTPDTGKYITLKRLDGSEKTMRMYCALVSATPF